MFNLFQKRAQPAQPALPPGKRVYAIGDVHGRFDLARRMLARIEADAAGRPPTETFVVFLGDLIDRGPDSRGVVDYLLSWRPSFARPVFLLGNHEESLLAALDGDFQTLRNWLRVGGFECVESYGVAAEEIAAMDPPELLARLRAAIPSAHADFLRGFYDSFALGDYLFVHAGVRPGVPMAAQTPRDMRWIRADFLTAEADHGMVVVHGHSIVEAPERHANRLALDTGAYRSGRLSAVRLTGSDVDFMVVDDR